jgi:hypothetical protein
MSEKKIDKGKGHIDSTGGSTVLSSSSSSSISSSSQTLGVDTSNDQAPVYRKLTNKELGLENNISAESEAYKQALEENRRIRTSLVNFLFFGPYPYSYDKDNTEVAKKVAANPDGLYSFNIANLQSHSGLFCTKALGVVLSSYLDAYFPDISFQKNLKQLQQQLQKETTVDGVFVQLRNPCLKCWRWTLSLTAQGNLQLMYKDWTHKGYIETTVLLQQYALNAWINEIDFSSPVSREAVWSVMCREPQSFFNFDKSLF